MTAKQPIATRFTISNVCPVCDSGSKGCSATADGLHLCRGEPADLHGWVDVRKGQEDKGGFHNYRRADDARRITHPQQNKKPMANCTTDWRAQAERFAAALDDDRRAELARSLRLPVEALDALPVIGWKDGERCWTFPEVNPAGAVVGLNRRFHDGKKVMLRGDSRGLTLPTGWRDRPGPVFVVEGASDVLAMTHAGLPCVGRPSNSGGADLLAELLRDLPPDRDILIVGENDRKPNGDWPGHTGAERVAKALATKLRRRVPVALPPDDSKDVRDWLAHPDRGESLWPDRGAELSAVLLAAVERIDPTADSATGTIARRANCPEIVIGTDEFRVNAEATAALAGEEGIYQRGGLLVSVLEQAGDPDTEAMVRRPDGGPVIRDLAKPLLRERLTRCARFVQVKANADGEQRVPVHPPGWAVDVIHTRGDWPHVPRLEAVVTHPVLLPDGTVLAGNGYHSQSGILVRLPPDLRVHVPDRPTRADVAAALEALFDPLADFPFETPAHRAALLAGLLTPLAWFAFPGPAPLFLIDANVRAVGKGLLGDVAAIALTGRRFPAMTYTNDKEELRKRITTAAVEGERTILFDNLAGPVGNDVLDSALTSDRWKDRLLGGNRMFDGPLHVTWWGTGNNVQLVGDTPRRVCHVRLDSREEQPEMRAGFRYSDLRGRVRATRGLLLSAALTLLRGWCVAGKPTHGLTPWGSFEGWSSVVREAVVCAGLPDPGETRIAFQTAADRDAGAMAAVLDGLARMDPGRRGLTAGDIITKLKETSPAPEWVSDMRAAVDDLCGKLDGRTLGGRLRHFQRRNFGGRMIDKAGADRTKTTRWAVFEVRSHVSQPGSSPASPGRAGSTPGDAGDAGDAGDVPTPEKSAAEHPDGSPAAGAGVLFDNPPARGLPD